MKKSYYEIKEMIDQASWLLEECETEQKLDMKIHIIDMRPEPNGSHCPKCKHLNNFKERKPCANCRIEVRPARRDIIPELPEAALRNGKAYLATVEDKRGCKKDVIGGYLQPDLVREWMEQMKLEGRETYGVPERGYAGAYHL